jgi:hypothetical protein
MFGLDTGFIRYGDLHLVHMLQLLQATITETTIALVAFQIPLTELHCADVSPRGLISADSGD